MENNELTSAEISRNLSLLKKLMQCGNNIYMWTYSAKGELLSTNCPNLVLNQIFMRSLCHEKMLEHAAVSRLPAAMSAVMGFIWGAAFEYGGDELSLIHVIGPVFSSKYEPSELMKALGQFEIPPEFRPKLSGVLMNISIVPTMQFYRFILMLHCCVTGQQLGRKDIVILRTESDSTDHEPNDLKRNRSRVYMAEQALLNNVRTGDRDYRRELETAGQVSIGVGFSSGVPLEQARISVIVFSSLCTRAAIEGGLSPETAYTVGDRYIQEAGQCRNITGLQTIADRMYDDFITRVHRLRELKGISPQIRACIELLEENPEEDISLSDIASHVNYAEYYLSRKFRQEVGMSISEYSHKVRIERAKILLLTTTLPIYEIAARLHYSSSSHFSDRFLKLTGALPQDYRENNGK